MRARQGEAIKEYWFRQPKDFLISTTPSAPIKGASRYFLDGASTPPHLRRGVGSHFVRIMSPGSEIRNLSYGRPRLLCPKTNWSLQPRFFDPTLSEILRDVARLEVSASGCYPLPQVFLLATPTGDWFQPFGSSCLAQRTKLLTPSVAHLPVFKIS